MSKQIYISGKFVPQEDAKISVFDHGLLYGDGIFEGLRAYGGKVFRLRDHVTRLYESAKAIWLTIPISFDQMCDAVNEAVRIKKLDSGYIRLVVTRGAGTLGLDPNRCSDPQVIIIADAISLYPKELYEKGGELSAAIELRRHFPGVVDNVHTRDCARTIAGWVPLPIPQVKARRLQRGSNRTALPRRKS